LEFADIEDEESAEALLHGFADHGRDCDRVGPGAGDEIGGIGGGRLPGREFVATPDMDGEIGHGAIEIATPLAVDIEPDWRVASQGLGDGFDHGGPGAGPAHGRAPRRSSSNGRAARMAACKSAMASASGAPVNSSMKIFLNSTAMAQPVWGKCSCTKRVCS